MPAASFSVVFTESAEADLYEIEAYWTARGEAWRGEKYFNDLGLVARRELTESANARRGRQLRSNEHPDAREILAFGIYRIIYEIDEAAGVVNVLRFWHARRDEPGSDA